MDRAFHASRHPRIRRDSPNRNEGFGRSFQLQIASDFRLGNYNPTQSRQLAQHLPPNEASNCFFANAQLACTGLHVEGLAFGNRRPIDELRFHEATAYDSSQLPRCIYCTI